jgi:nicotinamide mononucleotide adenylyltransferase
MWSPPDATHGEDASVMTTPAEKHLKATTVGRFQLVTYGHLAAVKTILEQWDTLTICLSDPDLEPPPGERGCSGHRDEEYFRLTEQNFAAVKNPFSSTERIRMWNAALERAGIQDRVSCRAIPRLSIYPDHFNNLVPPDEYDLVFGRSSDPYDQIKIRALPQLLGRRVVLFDLPIMFNTTKAKARVAAGEPWTTVLAPGIAEVFYEIGGPDRMVLPAPAPETAPHG